MLQLTSDGIDQELVVGWAILQFESNETSLAGPSNVEWNANGYAAVIRVGEGDQCLGKGEGREGGEGLCEEHLEDLVYRRRCRESLTNVVVRNWYRKWRALCF